MVIPREDDDCCYCKEVTKAKDLNSFKAIQFTSK